MPKYQVIADWLSQQVEQGIYGAGEKLPSEQELRSRFSVSRQTVRKALEILEKQGLVKGRQGSGTYVTDWEAKEREKSRRIAVVTTYVDNYIFPKIIQGIEQVLSGQGFQVQISFTNNSFTREEEILESLLEQDLGGLIIEGTKSALPNPNLFLYRRLMEREVPILFLNSGYRELACPVASLDDLEAGRAAARHFLELGHRKLGGLLKSDDGQGCLRYQGFLEELKRAGVPLDGSRFVWFDTGDTGHFSDMEKRILRRFSGCTGILCYNDSAAVELMELLKKNGIRVPEDLSLVSIDDTDLAVYGDVGLTSVHHPKEVLGEAAARLLLSMIGKNNLGFSKEEEMPEQFSDFLFEARLVKRESVKDLRQ